MADFYEARVLSATANVGAFHKIVTVSANVEGGSVVLYLKGEVDTKTSAQ